MIATLVLLVASFFSCPPDEMVCVLNTETGEMTCTLTQYSCTVGSIPTRGVR